MVTKMKMRGKHVAKTMDELMGPFVEVFRLQVNNGIPLIRSWFDDPSDSALTPLLSFLEALADADDVRPIVAKKFSNKEHEFLISS